ncbi:MAG: DEAD/DEAH box helicase family protein [Thermoguttaceae bacterium]|nr:DEAD/DEAH box helicase family protein [Thermoguttaceae bacterium]
MLEEYAWYDTDYLSGAMSLRKPQSESLKVLEELFKAVDPQKNIDLSAALERVHEKCPTCTNFERDFVSLTFALATGVGKTRLMGAFIAWLYTQQEIKNFFIVAPNMTIYDKLRKEFSNPTHPKYVFKGLGCFTSPPKIIAGEDYRYKTLPQFETEATIFIFNIDKFNKEDSNMRHLNEYLGKSFYERLTDIQDLVLIMDESHHYRAERGAAALNDLEPILGLELTATPKVTKGSRTELFKNVVYEYPLSKAIADGYVRTPYAMTRTDVNFFHFGEEALDKLMIDDGIKAHERIKSKLETYAQNNNRPLVKPFMLIVCKDTQHASWVERYVKSNEFRSGAYRDKTIILHSKLKGAESEENTQLLLNVERPDNPVEIVIHVNKLKEGWDVNNLYTIVPLRAAASDVLKEQMVGRGLRLPYGERTGDKDVDSVVLTAHNNFEALMAEAQRGDSLFKAGNIIKAEEIVQEQACVTQLNFPELNNQNYEIPGVERTPETDELVSKVRNYLREQAIQQQKPDMEVIQKALSNEPDLGEVFKKNKNPLLSWLPNECERVYKQVQSNYIPIPLLRITSTGVDELIYHDFDLDLSEFIQSPIENNLLIQSITDPGDKEIISGSVINFSGYNPKKAIAQILCRKPEIIYEENSDLIIKLISQVCDHFQNQFGFDGMSNVVLMYKKGIADKIYNQMLKHSALKRGLIEEEIFDVKRSNLLYKYNYSQKVNLFDDNFDVNIHSVLFTGIEKGVFAQAKFDSSPELVLARILESNTPVKKWLRPAPTEFELFYNGKRYEPDFVAQTADCNYLIEVKGEDRINDEDVIAKKQRAITYCSLATKWSQAHGFMPWKHLFIPSQAISIISSFTYLSNNFIAEQ